MPDQVVPYAAPADVVRAFLAADSLEEFGRRTRRDYLLRAKGLTDEGLRIEASNLARAKAIRCDAADALGAHPEWLDEVNAALDAAKKRSENAA